MCKHTDHWKSKKAGQGDPLNSRIKGYGTPLGKRTCQKGKPECPFTYFTILPKHWPCLKHCRITEMTIPQSSYNIKLPRSSDPLQCLLPEGDRLISQSWIRSVGNRPGHFWRLKFSRETLVFLCRVWILTNPSKIQSDAPSCTYQALNMPQMKPYFVMTSPCWIKNFQWLSHRL